MAVPLIEITRGEVVECVHRGDIAVCDASGALRFHAGDPDKLTYMRSCAKPMQALNVLLSGAARRFGFGSRELAVFCSSHYAQEHHLRTIREVLAAIGCRAEDIRGGVVPSLSPAEALRQAARNEPLTELHSDCSGKHAGFLSVCRHKGYSIAEYLDPGHPCQQEVLDIIALLTGYPRDEILVGIDGCTAPVHALPLRFIAAGFARLADPQGLPADVRKAVDAIFAAMVENPRMIAGDGGFCTDLIAAAGGKLIGKIGAEGVYCVGCRSRGLGIALKIESGSMAVLPPVIMQVLKRLEILDALELRRLAAYLEPPNRNDLQQAVGQVRTRFELTAP